MSVFDIKDKKCTKKNLPLSAGKILRKYIRSGEFEGAHAIGRQIDIHYDLSME